MGRLSRYRKTKACDPFNLAPNKLVHLDKAPSKNELENDEQRAPRAFRHLMSFAKRVERNDAAKKARRDNKKAPAGGTTTGEDTSSAVKEVSKSKAEPDEEKRKPGNSFTRLRGESDEQYIARIDQEGAAKMVKAVRDLKPMSVKRKTYLTNKKQRKKGVQEETKEFARTEAVRFGDVVQAPPTLSCKPRRAPAQSGEKLVKNLKLKADLDNASADQSQATAPASKAPASKQKADVPAVAKCKKSKNMGQHERERMERARSTAIDLYRKHKKLQMEQRSAGQ